MRAKGGRATLAIDPESGHNSGNSRYLSIPWIFAVIKGQQNAEKIRPIAYSEHGIWFPDENIGEKWEAFTKLGKVPDASAPELPPYNLKAKKAYYGIALSWNVVPDWESGIKTFRIYRDGQLLPPYSTPLRPIDKEDFTENFREPSGMDTPNAPVSQMIYNDTLTEKGAIYEYEVSFVNWSGLESLKSRPIKIKSP